MNRRESTAYRSFREWTKRTGGWNPGDWADTLRAEGRGREEINDTLKELVLAGDRADWYAGVERWINENDVTFGAAAPMPAPPARPPLVRIGIVQNPFIGAIGAGGVGMFGVLLLGVGVLLLVIGVAERSSCFGGACGAGVFIAGEIVGSLGLFFALLGVVSWTRRTAEGLLQIDAKVDRLLEQRQTGVAPAPAEEALHAPIGPQASG